MERIGARRALSAMIVTVAVAACGTVPPSPPASAGPSATPAPSPTSTSVPVSGWVSAGTLQLARASAHAVALADGGVLVVGSDNICTPGGAWDESVAAEVFDPATATWTTTGGLNAPRDGFVAVALLDGQVLVTGGMTSEDPAEGEFGAYSSTKLYDPRTGTWSAKGLLNVARHAAAGALLADGTVLVAGGTYFDSSTDRERS